MKDYIVLYYIKANRRQTAHTMRIEAKNASEACKEAKRIVFEQTGRNAFRPEAMIYEEGMTTESIVAESALNWYQKRIDEASNEAYRICNHRELLKVFVKTGDEGFTITKDSKGKWKVRS